jgi:hypothetical protein
MTMTMTAPDLFVPSEETLRKARKLLRSWLSSRLGKDDLAWLDVECKAVAADAEAKRFYMAFSAAGRHAAAKPLALSAADRAAADRARPSWMPGDWTEEQAARTVILLHRSFFNRERWLGEVRMLFEHADLGEQVALYQALPLLPHPEAHVDRCAEGIRTNMTDVFRAVAHRNPFPAENLSEAAWNQMVLKALFVEAGLAGVLFLDERANPVLARMLCDFAHERWAAGRPVPPELWRCVGPHADEAALRDLEKAWDGGDGATKAAVADALRRCPFPEARRLLTSRGLPLPEEEIL